VTWLGSQGSSVAYEVNFDDALTSDSSSGDPTVDAGDAVEETESGDGDSGDTGPPCDPPGQGGRPPGQGGLIPGTCELAPPYDTDAPV